MSNEFTPAGTKRSNSRKEPMAQVSAPSKAEQAAHPADAAPVYPENDWVARRIEEVREKRRGRTSITTDEYQQRLSIPEDRKDPRMVYRMVLDTGTRVHDLRAKDWEIAPGDVAAGDDRNVGSGTVIERMGNTRTVPKPERHVLMCKPKEFYDADYARKQAKIKSREDEMKRGRTRDPDGQIGAAGGGFYVPEGGIKIDRA